MDRASIREVIRDVWPGTPMLDTGDWVTIPCPVSQWTHDSGADRTPSFGIHVEENGTSVVNCFTCHTKMPFHALLQKYSDLSGDDLGTLVEEVEREEFLGPRKLQGWDAIKHDRMVDHLMPIPEGVYMSLYESAHNHPYVLNRGISPRTSKKLELLFDPGDQMQDKEPRILFPVRGVDGLLYGFSGRAIRKSAELKVRDYYGLKKSRLILGAHLARDTSQEVVVTEGLFDYANGHECGANACAVMHSSMTPEQAQIMIEIGRRVYVAMDRDKAGRTGAQIIGRALHEHLPVLIGEIPKVWIEDGSKEGGHWLKDLGEIEREELLVMVETAKLFVDPRPQARYARGTR